METDGTSVICGGCDGGVDSLATAGLSPCNSNFLSSSVAIKVRISAAVCFFSLGEETASLS